MTLKVKMKVNMASYYCIIVQKIETDSGQNPRLYWKETTRVPIKHAITNGSPPLLPIVQCWPHWARILTHITSSFRFASSGFELLDFC